MGFIKLSHKMLDWEWYGNTNVKVLFIHCLLKANYKPGSWHGIHYEAGQFITSLSTLSKETGQTIRMVRDNLDKLKMTGELTSTILPKGRLITVNNWHQYQTNDKVDDREMTSTLTSKPTSNTATDKEYKNIRIKEEKHIYGEYGHVRLTDKEKEKLETEFGLDETKEAILFLDEYIERKGYKAKSHYLCIRKWVFDAVKEEKQKKDKNFFTQKVNKFANFDQRKYNFDELEKEANGSM